MRQQGQQNRRGRPRNNGGRKMQNPLSRNYDSNGPDVKIRGTAAHIAEKYTSLARDALSSGDPVTAENLFQHAEHYNRIIMSAQSQGQGDAQPVVADQDENTTAPENAAGSEKSDRPSRSRNSKNNGSANNNRRRRRRPTGNGSNMKNGSDAKEAKEPETKVDTVETAPLRETKVETATSADISKVSSNGALI